MVEYEDTEDERPEDMLEETSEEEIGEEIPETHEGRVVDEGIFVEEPGSLAELGYGFEEDGGVLLPDVAAYHLMRRGVLDVRSDGEVISSESVLRRGLESDRSFFLKYIVYRDLRIRGRKVRGAIGETPYLWFYEKPKRPCSHLVAVYPRNETIGLTDLWDLISTGGRMKKGVYLALVDEEVEVSYYEIKRFGLRASFPSASERVDTAQIVGPMAVVWDTDGALSLYKEGYFGKPIGLRKPRSMDFERPITLSFAESLYLSEKGRLEIAGMEGRVDSCELAATASAEQNFTERLLVYKLLKQAGLVVKSGMKFGVDFAVYEYGPGVDHAPFLIHVYRAGSSITPTEIVRAGRLAASVKKKFVIAEADADLGRVNMLSFARVKP